MTVRSLSMPTERPSARGADPVEAGRQGGRRVKRRMVSPWAVKPGDTLCWVFEPWEGRRERQSGVVKKVEKKRRCFGPGWRWVFVTDHPLFPVHSRFADTKCEIVRA